MLHPLTLEPPHPKAALWRGDDLNQGILGCGTFWFGNAGNRSHAHITGYSSSKGEHVDGGEAETISMRKQGSKQPGRQVERSLAKLAHVLVHKQHNCTEFAVRREADAYVRPR